MQTDRRLLVGLAVLLVVVMAVANYILQHNRDLALLPAIGSEATPVILSDEIPPQEIQVYVGGAVANPGVFCLQEGNRVHQALALAVPLPGADLCHVGMARELIDGESILVPDLTAMETELGVVPVVAGTNSKVNINQATAAEMAAALDGIGVGLAQRIVDYRGAHGPFKKTEEIKKVSGIGEKRYEAIKDQISVY